VAMGWHNAGAFREETTHMKIPTRFEAEKKLNCERFRCKGKRCGSAGHLSACKGSREISKGV
jgi:hypothetical protein